MLANIEMLFDIIVMNVAMKKNCIIMMAKSYVQIVFCWNSRLLRVQNDFMLSYIFLAIIKIFDNVILTAKSLATYKEQKILSSILVVISQLIFYLVIDQVIEDNTILAIVIVSISSGIGNYVAFIINNKFKRDTKWTFIITSSNLNDIQNLCGYLAEHKIKYIANNGLTRKGKDTINVLAFSKSKDDSRLIEKFLEGTESKYLKEII